MVLAVDGSRLEGHRTGVGRHLEWLLRACAGQELPFEEVRVYSRAPVADLPAHPRLRGIALPGRGPGVWWQVSRLRPRASRADVLFSTYTLPPGYRGRSVVAVLGILAGPHAVSSPIGRARAAHIAWSARRATVVLAVSATTKDDLVRYYRVPAERVRVVRPGLDPRFRSTAGETAERPFLLFVGKLSHRRNVPALIEAFRRLGPDHPELELLVVGPNTGGVDLDALPPGARHVEFLELDELAHLYRTARALVLPTEREGHSQPALEAMASGCPVVVPRGAAIGVLEKLTDEEQAALVLHTDDARPEALERALRRIVADDELHAQLAERGRAFAATSPSWDDHARTVLDTLAEVAEAGR